MKFKLNHIIVLIVVISVAALFSCQQAAETQLTKRVVNVGTTVAGAPYSPGIIAGNTFYCAGKLGFDPETGEVAEGIENQTKFALEAIKEVLNAGGYEMSDVVMANVYLTNTDDYAGMNNVYKTFFPEDPPARVTVTVADLVRGASIEISCIAVK
ncbi:MAG: RidA family protein [bacterium]|nr:RidA family protein [bacterium]